MVTNPIQNVKLNYGDFFIRMKDKEVRLNNVIDAANALRIKRGHQPVLMTNYLRTNNFIEIVIATEIKLNLRAPDDYSKPTAYKRNGTDTKYQQIKSPVVRTGVGKFGGTWCHSWIAIDTAAHLDKELAVDLYEILMTSPIFQLREESGDLYKDLVDAVVRMSGKSDRLPNRLQFLARIIAARAELPIRPDNTTWNYATAEQLQIRHQIQDYLISFIQAGFILTYQALVETAATFVFRKHMDLPAANLSELVKDKLFENAYQSYADALP